MPQPRLALMTMASNRIDVYQGRRHVAAYQLANDHDWADVTPELIEQVRIGRVEAAQPPQPPQAA